MTRKRKAKKSSWWLHAVQGFMSPVAPFGFLLAALTFGCSDAGTPPPSWTGTIDLSALPAEHAAVFESALEQWRAADARVQTRRADGDPTAFPFVEDNVPPGDAGAVFADHAAVLPCDFASDAGRALCLDTALHELGHVLGAAHVDDLAAAMYRDVHPITTLTDADRESLERGTIGVER